MPKSRYRVVIAVLLFFASAIIYIDRSSIGLAAPLIREELHISASQMGLVFSGFFLGYTLFAFIGGRLSDRFGPRRVLSCAMAAWTIVSASTATVTGLWSILLIRLMMGPIEGPILSTANRMVANWFPRREAGRTLGFLLSGVMFGSAVAGPLVGLVAARFGWRGAFLCTASIGAVWFVCWRLFSSDSPRTSKGVSPDELALIESDRSDDDASVSTRGAMTVQLLRRYLFSPGVLGTAVGLFALSYSIYVLVSWFPTYLVEVHRVDIVDMGWLVAIPWVAGIPGSILGGMISDYLVRRTGNALRARKRMIYGSLSLAGASILLFSTVSSLGTAIACLIAALMLLASTGQACWSIIHELVPRKWVGSVGGFVHLLANTAGIIGPALTGVIIERSGGFGFAFRAVAAVDIVAALTVLALVNARLSTRSQKSFG
jgi:MFS transporter, ACS family, hexuronate transporter